MKSKYHCLFLFWICIKHIEASSICESEPINMQMKQIINWSISKSRTLSVSDLAASATSSAARRFAFAIIIFPNNLCKWKIMYVASSVRRLHKVSCPAKTRGGIPSQVGGGMKQGRIQRCISQTFRLLPNRAKGQASDELSCLLTL